MHNDSVSVTLAEQICNYLHDAIELNSYQHATASSEEVAIPGFGFLVQNVTTSLPVACGAGHANVA